MVFGSTTKKSYPDGIHSWLTVHPRELIVLAVDNMDAGASSFGCFGGWV